MARTKISEFSATAADNTDIDNIDIAEGCAPSGINNAIRELMSQLKDMQTGASGDTFTLTTVNSTTVDTTNLEVTNLKAKDGTAAGSIADSTGLVTLTNLTGTTADYTNLEVTNLKAKDGTASASIADSTGVFTHSTNTVFPAGAVATPSITTAGDTNTGMYFPAADTIGFAAGGGQGFSVGTTASAVNYLEARGSATAGAPRIVSLGTDTNVPIALSTKGTGEIRFSTNSLERMRVDGTGKVGIGTDAPAGSLQVVGGILARGGAPGASGINNNGYAFTGSGGDNDSGMYSSADGRVEFYTNSVERMSISTRAQFVNGSASRGANGYPITTPDDSIANALRADGYIEWQSDVGSIGTNYFLSDIRKKRNIQPSMTPALPVINAIELIDFDWAEGSGETGRVNVGVSAQQLKTVNEQFVAELSDGTLMVRDPKIFPFLIKAIQEQQAIISAMETRLAALEAQ